jgi:hypothetical protein
MRNAGKDVLVLGPDIVVESVEGVLRARRGGGMRILPLRWSRNGWYERRLVRS